MQHNELVVGVDVGGTRIKVVALTAAGEVADTQTVPTPVRPGDGIVDVIASVVTEFRVGLEGPVAAVGAVVPGLVDDATGRGVWSANLGWRDLDLRGELARALVLPVAVGHDVRAGLVGEARFGAARGAADVLFVPLGTGIAGAMLTGGRVVAGSEWTGEIGHVTVDPGGPECGCGRRGCLEAIASARALGTAWQAAGREGDAAALSRAVGAGDPVAQEIWDHAIASLVRVVAPITAAAGTRLLLLGGGVVNAGTLLLEPVAAALHSSLGHDTVQVRAAQLGDRAGSLGAAALALDLLAD